jgi:hypothetical protein
MHLEFKRTKDGSLLDVILSKQNQNEYKILLVVLIAEGFLVTLSTYL